MSITYELRDIFKILINKWYIILISVLLCACISYPLAVQSNSNAKDDYKSLTNEDIVDNTINAVTYFRVNMSQVDMEGNIGLDLTIAQNIASYMKRYISEDQDLLSDNNVILKKLKFSEMDDLPVIVIEAKKANEGDYINYINEFPKFIESSLIPIVGEQFSVELIDTNVKLREVPLNKAVLNNPTQVNSRIKIMVTASICGLLLSIVGILIIDFIRTSKIVQNKNSVQ